MAVFNDLDLDVKWAILDHLKDLSTDMWNDYYVRDRRWKSLERTEAICSLRLTCRRNLADYTPLLGKLHDAWITLDSHGVSQLEWLAHSSMTPYITGLKLFARFVFKDVLVYDELGPDRTPLPKMMQKRAKRMARQKNAFALEITTQKQSSQMKPFSMPTLEWQQYVQSLKDKVILGTKPMSIHEYKDLTADDGNDENVARILATLSQFPAIRHVRYGWVAAAQHVELQPSREVGHDLAYRWRTSLDQGECWPVQPPHSTQVLKLLQSMPIGPKIQTLELPIFGQGIGTCLSISSPPTEEAYTSLFDALPNLDRLDLVGDYSEWAGQKDKSFLSIVVRSFASHPRPNIKCIILRSCKASYVRRLDGITDHDPLFDMIKASSIESLIFKPELCYDNTAYVLELLRTIRATRTIKTVKGLGLLSFEGMPIRRLPLPISADNLDKWIVEYEQKGEPERSRQTLDQLEEMYADGRITWRSDREGLSDDD